MWNYSLVDLNADIIESFKKAAKVTGIIFIVLGLIGIIYPVFMSETALAFLAFSMLFLGLISAFFTYKINPSDWSGWLKSFILIVMPLLMLYYPKSAIAVIGLLFAIYFLMDAFASFMIAFELKPLTGWGWWFFNGLTSFVLALLFIVGWPFSSVFMVGLFIGVSLLFDGIALLAGVKLIDKRV